MGEPETLHVRNEVRRELVVREEARLPLAGLPLPRSEVHLVDGHRALEPAVGRRPFRHPCAVLPGVPREVVDDGCGARRDSAVEGERVGLLEDVAALRTNLELVAFARLQIGDEDSPDAARQEIPHRVDAPVPAVEVAHDADALCVRLKTAKCTPRVPPTVRRWAPSLSHSRRCLPSPNRCRSKLVITCPKWYGSRRSTVTPLAKCVRMR